MCWVIFVVFLRQSRQSLHACCGDALGDSFFVLDELVCWKVSVPLSN